MTARGQRLLHLSRAALWRLMLEALPRVLSVGCNPLLLATTGEGYTVVDALIILEKA